MDRAQLTDEHPILFHMAEDGTWPSIQKHGLLSTKALVDLYDPPPADRAAILQNRRSAGFVLEDPARGRAVVRDQKPLQRLDRLAPGTTPQEFLDLLNGRVFFWLTHARLDTLLRAKAYRDHAQLVLYFDTAELLERHGAKVQLSPYNSGSITRANSPVRGRDLFCDIDDFPYDNWRKKGRSRSNAVVELTVDHAVPDAGRLAVRVERWQGGHRTETLHQR
ncbi:hypothetical protein CFP65_6688 [Kitasatospora sp. MMS16-BH015]|uniref:DUF7002 family protein n=1 Tax=Kitasatospora sp. MMS16-BH015 TaxID=2018025 RepID=UPI000CA24F05|nr:hypothetical protein [Kitasatospora sp. MMS16-BH015]AUG81333.1 hypothetical protein CFP65_6688 [Kitasatospora sp. MMS16-BH015]